MSNKNKGIFDFHGELMVNVGHGNLVRGNDVVAILESGPLPSRRLRENAAKNNRLIDASAGKKMRSLLVTQSNHIIVSALTPPTLSDRLRGTQKRTSSAQIELEEGEFIS